MMEALGTPFDGRDEDEVVSQYARLVRTVIRPYFLSGGDVDDLYQEGMLGLLKAIRTYDPARSANFETYAAVCIRNRIFDALRRQERVWEKRLCQVDSPSSPFSYPADNVLSDPETEVLASESAQEIKTALSGLLSAFEASVLEPYLQGYTASEIAARLGRPAKSVDNAIRRIRRKFAQYLSQGDNRKPPVRINPTPQEGKKER